MKLLTLNFLTCARKACKPHSSSFPLHPRDATLEAVEADLNLPFLANILPRLEWAALLAVCSELGLPGMVEGCPEREALFADASSASGTVDETVAAMRDGGEQQQQQQQQEQEQEEKQQEQKQQPSQLARDLHRLLIETCISDGKLVCGNCGHEYAIKEGIANFLLPPHLV